MATRNPRKGKGSKWTALELKNVPADWAGDRLSEAALYGQVRVSASGDVSVRWLTPFKWDGKQAWHYCGTTPVATLEEIREQRDWCRAQVKAGINPAARKRLDKIEAEAAVETALAAADALKSRDRTFSDMADDWLSRGVQRQNGNAELRRQLDKDVLPTLGALPVRLVNDKQLGEVIQAVIARGSNRGAVIVAQFLRQMYGWAVKRQPWRDLIAEGQRGNPMEIVEIRPLLPKSYDMNNVRSRVLSDSEIRSLRDQLAATQRTYDLAPNKRTAAQPLERTTQAAIWLCLSTLCRIGELGLAEWTHIDLDAATWFIPKANTKERQSDLLVYLSEFARHEFKTLQAITGKSRWCFPSINDPKIYRDLKTPTKQISDRQARFKDGKRLAGRRSDNTLVVGNEAWTPHDLRRTGATLMQRLGVSLEVIDKCQNHVLAGSKVRRHYLTHDYAHETRDAWSLLGSHLSTLLNEESPSMKRQLAANSRIQ